VQAAGEIVKPLAPPSTIYVAGIFEGPCDSVQNSGPEPQQYPPFAVPALQEWSRTQLDVPAALWPRARGGWNNLHSASVHRAARHIHSPNTGYHRLLREAYRPGRQSPQNRDLPETAA